MPPDDHRILQWRSLTGHKPGACSGAVASSGRLDGSTTASHAVNMNGAEQKRVATWWRDKFGPKSPKRTIRARICGAHLNFRL